jgi:hypothetical protein
MNGMLKASIRAIPERTIYVVAGSSAVAGAAIALLIVAIAGVPFGVVVSYALAPFALALVAWVLVALARLRLVGFLPSEAEGLIPTRLQPWIRSWLLVRFGLLGSGLLLILAAVATAIAHRPFGRVVEAFVCVVWFRIFLDLVFGATFNAGVIWSSR